MSGVEEAGSERSAPIEPRIPETTRALPRALSSRSQAAARATTTPEAKSLLRNLPSLKAELEVFCVNRLTNPPRRGG